MSTTRLWKRPPIIPALSTALAALAVAAPTAAATPTPYVVAQTQGPVGPQGPTGAQGSRGATGPQGPAGPAGKVVCQDTAIAKFLCSVTFAPGSWMTQIAAIRANFVIARGGRAVARGSVMIRRGRLTLSAARRLRPGRYTVTLTTGHGRRERVLLRRSVTIR